MTNTIARTHAYPSGCGSSRAVSGRRWMPRRRGRLDQVDVVTGDATLTDQYHGMAPADVVMLCGIFGNIAETDIKRAVGFSPQLCAGGGAVIWTRNRRAPDLVPAICAWFEEFGFEREWVSDPDAGFGVGVHRFTGRPRALAAGEQMFRFASR